MSLDKMVMIPSFQISVISNLRIYSHQISGQLSQAISELLFPLYSHSAQADVEMQHNNHHISRKS